MNQLTEIQPSRELKFTFEVKKQITCNVQLINKTDQHVAFKVKTTSPKKYCVRPNVGVILPKETCEFVVLMQAQRSPPPDMICKDKFLVQSTIVPAGTMEDDVTSDMFSKEDGKYIEERKLKVILVNPPHSPEISPLIEKVMQVPPVESSVAAHELLTRTERHSPSHVDVEGATELEKANGEVKKPMADARLKADENVEAELTKAAEPVNMRDYKQQDVEGATELKKVNGEVKKPMAAARLETDENVEAELTKAAEPVTMRDFESQPIEVVESKSVVKLEVRPLKRMEPRMVKEAGDLRLAKDVKEMKSKLLELELKFGQAEKTISKLMEERISSIQERQLLQQDLVLLRTQRVQKTIHEGFPLLFMCMVAMISIVIGYLLHP